MRHLPMALAMVSLGCADTTFTAEGYSQSCELEHGCTTIFVGDVCGCSCEVVAISFDDIYLAEAERAELMESCGEVLECAPCPDVGVSCVDSVCVLD
ncbi:MAG: hypothetical protein H6740_14200 [Alphaproteobacteria bacterium]|nr:hypothetical protein [Alphaproteobacteria bacterium]